MVEPEVSVYWQPGCTSCLRAKEYLTRHNVPFRSRNVLADDAAYNELARFGLKRVPIVSKGEQWVDGQSLKDIARLVGIAHQETRQLPPAVLVERLFTVIDGAGRFVGQIAPVDLEGTVLPNRPRSLTQLAYHLFNVADALVEHEEGIALTFESYCREPVPGTMTKAELLAYGTKVRGRVADWWATKGPSRDWKAPAQVYYAEQTMHDYLERTTWHAGQHTRQLMWAMQDKLGLTPDRPLGSETFGNLPMPQSIWDPA
ncbi:MAG: glutaredoxin domain-containing protein [Hyphomicrobiaceae bacterium]